MRLVLGRRAGQGIRIGDDVEVHVVEVSGGKVRLAVTAPADLVIVRTELDTTKRRDT